MLRNLLLMGVAAMMAVAIPVLYETHPAYFETVVKSALRTGPSEPATATIRTRSIQADEVKSAGAEVQLPSDASGHFTGEFRFNGRDVAALVDTGATLVAMNMSTARHIGINPSPGEFVHPVRTANGTTTAATARIDSLQIGQIRIDDVEAMILEDSALATTLVGMSFLNRLAGFRVENSRLVLRH